MEKADFLKAARAAAPHILAQIQWLEGRDPGEDDKEWFQALNVLDKECSALLDKLDTLKEKAAELEAAGGFLRDAFWSAQDNAFDTARDERWDMEQLETQVAFYGMATDEDTIRELLPNQ